MHSKSLHFTSLLFILAAFLNISVLGQLEEYEDFPSLTLRETNTPTAAPKKPSEFISKSFNELIGKITSVQNELVAMMRESEKCGEKWIQKEKKVEEQESEIKKRSTELEQKEEYVNETAVKLRSEEENVQVRENKLQEKEQSVKIQEEKLSKKQRHLELQKAEVNIALELLKQAKTDENIVEEENEIKNPKIDVVTQIEEIKQMVENITKAEAELAEREKILKKREAKLERKENNTCSLSWVSASNGSVPENAVVGGYTADGEKLYLGRHTHRGDLIPGRVQPSDKCLYISYGFAEHKYSEYEVAVLDESNPCSISWVRSSYDLPSNTVVGGYTGMGDKLYIARTTVNGEVIPGKIHLKYRCMYIAYNHTEECHNEFEVATLE